MEEKHGGITYNNSDCLNVCIPRNMPPRFLMTKISICGYISEVELPNGSVLYEKEVSRYLSAEWREVVRSNALSIIKAAVGRSYGMDEAISSLFFDARRELLLLIAIIQTYNQRCIVLFSTNCPV
jgi:hypothetical protein